MLKLNHKKKFPEFIFIWHARKDNQQSNSELPTCGNEREDIDSIRRGKRVACGT